MKKYLRLSAGVIFAALALSSCEVPASSDDGTDSSSGDSGAVAIELSLDKSDTSDRGHWGIHAWVMKGTTYIDTLEYYADYSRYTDAKGASQAWVSDAGGELDGVSSATVTVVTGTPEAYTLSWDGKNYNGTAVPAGTYTLNLIVSRHTSTTPYGTHYVCDLALGSGDSSGTFSLKDTSADSTAFPYDVLASSAVTYSAE